MRFPLLKNTKSKNPAQSQESSATATVQFKDNRSNTTRLKEIQEMANGHNDVTQLKHEGTSTLIENTLETVQFAGHRPAVDMRIEYGGHTWTVQQSAEGNDMIRIFRPPNNTQNINWRTSDFKIIRANNDRDHDMREGEDAYGGYFQKNSKIREKFAAAKDKALEMIKTKARQSVQQAYRGELDALTLADFEITQRGPALAGAGGGEEAAEWQCNWTEGTQENPRRHWKFVIDSDNPLPESHQEPHVGWEVSAVGVASGNVDRTLGHIWLDFVPVTRVPDN